MVRGSARNGGMVMVRLLMRMRMRMGMGLKIRMLTSLSHPKPESVNLVCCCKWHHLSIRSPRVNQNKNARSWHRNPEAGPPNLLNTHINVATLSSG